MRTALSATLCVAMNLALFGSGAQAAVPAGITITPAGPITLNAPQGGISAGKTVKLKNTGAAPASLGSMVIAGPDSGDFSLSFDACSNHVLAVKKSCSMSVVYTGDGAMNAIHQGILEAQDSIGNVLASLQITGKTKKAAATIAVNVNSKGVMTISNNSSAGYQVLYNFVGQVDENPGGGPNVCFQDRDIAGGQSCSIQLVATSCQNTQGAQILVQAFPDAGGQQVNVTYILKHPLPAPSFCP